MVGDPQRRLFDRARKRAYPPHHPRGRLRLLNRSTSTTSGGSPDSLLNWMERLISTRKECPEFGWGELSFVETGHPKVLAHLCKRRGSYALAVHNLGAEDGDGHARV